MYQMRLLMKSVDSHCRSVKLLPPRPVVGSVLKSLATQLLVKELPWLPDADAGTVGEPLRSMKYTFPAVWSTAKSLSPPPVHDVGLPTPGMPSVLNVWPPSKLRWRNDCVVENPKIGLSYTVPSGLTAMFGSVPRRKGSATVS